MHVKILSKK